MLIHGAKTSFLRFIAPTAFIAVSSVIAVTAAHAQGAPVGAPGAKPPAAAPQAPAAKPTIRPGQIIGFWTAQDPTALGLDVIGPAVFHIMPDNLMEIHPAKGNTVYGAWQILSAGLELRVPGRSKTPKAEIAAGGNELKLDATVLTKGAKVVKKTPVAPAGAKPKAAPAGKAAAPVAAKPGAKPGVPPTGGMAPGGAAKPGAKPGAPPAGAVAPGAGAKPGAPAARKG